LFTTLFLTKLTPLPSFNTLVRMPWYAPLGSVACATRDRADHSQDVAHPMLQLGQQDRLILDRLLCLGEVLRNAGDPLRSSKSGKSVFLIERKASSEVRRIRNSCTTAFPPARSLLSRL
jgi:hypothetical protein